MEKKKITITRGERCESSIGSTRELIAHQLSESLVSMTLWLGSKVLLLSPAFVEPLTQRIETGCCWGRGIVETTDKLQSVEL